MKILILKRCYIAWVPRTPGEIVDVDAPVSAGLVASGYAAPAPEGPASVETAEDPTPVERTEPPETKRRRRK
jgi:hypothetical protein